MKTTWEWLKHHVETALSPQEVADKFTEVGYPTTLEPAYGWTQKFCVVEIVSVEKHPHADALSVCQVRTKVGGELKTIVCGASNVRAGMRSVLAHPGDILPGQKDPLRASELRGILSEGMLCSAQELDLQDALEVPQDGILDLSVEVVLGSSVWQLIPDNFILYVELTPNRGDLMSVRGLARELAALGGGTLKPYTLGDSTFPNLEPQSLTLSSEFEVQTHACRQLYLAHLRGVVNGISPLWMRQRLRATGHSPISTFVDITNYFCLDLGRPLHVFDADTLQGPIQVRLSQEGESLEGLDGVTHKLPAGLLVLGDAGGIVSLAGVLGGQRTACTAETTNLVLESAEFDPTLIAKAGQALHIHSEARTRFERGIDSDRVFPGLWIAATLANTLGGAQTPVEFSRGNCPLPAVSTVTVLPIHQIQTVCGVAIPSEEIVDRLKALGCCVSVASSEEIQVTPPSWRHDLRIPEDFIEEIVRVRGYAEIPSTLFLGQLPLSVWPRIPGLMQKARSHLVAEGFLENLTFSFMSEKKAAMFWTVENVSLSILHIQNPISQEWSHLRPSLLPNLLDIALYHKHHKIPFSPVFEAGSQFYGTMPGAQTEVVAAILPMQGSLDWTGQKAYSFYDVKGIVQRLLEALVGEDVSWEEVAGAPSWYHPGRSLTVKQDQKVVATLGQVHPRLASLFPGEHWMFEIFLESLPECPLSQKRFVLPPLQAVDKDLSFFLPKSMEIGPFMAQLMQAGKPELTHLTLLDVFPGQSPEEALSITVRGIFQPLDHTFSEEELHGFMNKLVLCARNLGATLRGQWEPSP